jgi:hypothetical protein
VVYFHGWPAHTHSHWSFFTGDLPTHTQSGLFSRATGPHTLTLVYFHWRPAHTYSLRSIFKGDLPFWLGLPEIPSDDLTRTKIGI